MDDIKYEIEEVEEDHNSCEIEQTENIDEIEDLFSNNCKQAIPMKSKSRYETAFKSFENWILKRGATFNEKTILSYFVHRHATLKSPSSLWAEYSMLRTMTYLNRGLDISKFAKVLAFIKKRYVGYRPKKSKYFTKEQMRRFLKEAPDNKYLMMKVVMIVGIAGACRREELANLSISNIEDKGEVIIINIPNKKTNTCRSFTIMNEADADDIQFLEIFRKYVSIRPKNSTTGRFFHGFRNGVCVNQTVGVNTMGKITSRIAEFLELEDPRSYTGHAFRRTSASFLANVGIDVLRLNNRQEGWDSNTLVDEFGAAKGHTEINPMSSTTYTPHNNALLAGSSLVMETKTVKMPSVKEIGVRGKIISSQTKEVITNVLKFMKEEAENGKPLIPLAYFKQRLIKATGISERTYRSINKEIPQDFDEFDPLSINDEIDVKPQELCTIKVENIDCDVESG